MFQEFYKPATIAEAVQLRRRYPSSVYVAGGTDVNSRGWHGRRPDVDRAIGIAHLPLGGIARADGWTTLGAGALVQELLDHPATPALLVQAARQFANRNIRNQATLGGHLAANQASNRNGSPSCSNLVPVLLALDAAVCLADGGAVPVDQYVGGHDPAGLILSLQIPSERLAAFAATRKFGRTATDVAILSVAVSFLGSPERIERPIIALGGVAPTALRLRHLEARLEGKPLPPRDDLEAWTRSMIEPPGDLRGSAGFKRRVAGALVGWALHKAVKISGGKA